MPDVEKLHKLEITGVHADLELHSFEGHEGISQLFEFVVTISTTEALAVASVVRAKAKLSMRSAAAATERDVHAVVSRVEEEAVLQRSGYFQYRVTLVPWAWMLVHGADNRIFQEKNVPEIVGAVLTGAGYSAGTDFKLTLHRSYSQREYCVQYRESNWDFVCRLIEEEGIFFFFEPTNGTLVFADTKDAVAAIEGNATLQYRPNMGGARLEFESSHVSRFRFAEEVRAGKVTLRDWDFQKPALDLETAKSGADDAKLELYDYPGEYVLPADGDAYAGVRLEELTAGRKTGEGESECARLAPGFSFTLAEHPFDAWNAKYLVTRIEHVGANPTFGFRGDEDEFVPYRNVFDVMPATVVFRPPRVTRRPHIHGVQTAIVVGPAGEEIYVDATGRVKVQFHWDRLGKKNDKSSCWVRVAQTWASAAFGAMFLPRINDEVVVAFVEGDPDRPLIVGSVYHGTNLPPYALPDDKTKSTIKSNSSKGGGGYNELRFEDKKGSEEVYLHAQKDWTIKVENDKNQVVGHDETLEVDHDRTKTVKNDQTATVEHDDTATVKNDQTLTVQHDRKVTVQNDHTETVSGNQTISVTKAQSLTVSDKQDIIVKAKRTLTVDDDVTETYKAKLTLSVTGDVSQELKGKHGLDVKGDQTVTVGGKQSVTITGDSVESVTGKRSITCDSDVKITAGASTVTIKPSGEITIKGAQMTIDASGPLKLHGATVEVKADAQINLKAPIVNGAADTQHTVKGATITLDGQMINVG